MYHISNTKWQFQNYWKFNDRYTSNLPNINFWPLSIISSSLFHCHCCPMFRDPKWGRETQFKKYWFRVMILNILLYLSCMPSGLLYITHAFKVLSQKVQNQITIFFRNTNILAPDRTFQQLPVWGYGLTQKKIKLKSFSPHFRQTQAKNRSNFSDYNIPTTRRAKCKEYLIILIFVNKDTKIILIITYLYFRSNEFER